MKRVIVVTVDRKYFFSYLTDACNLTNNEIIKVVIIV